MPPQNMLVNMDGKRRLEFWATLALRHCPGVGSRMLCRLLHSFGSAYEVFRRVRSGTLKGFGVTSGAVAALQNEVWRATALAEWQAAACCTGEIILWIDSSYPSLLRELPDAPALLYVRGDVELLRSPAVAVVGTRHCTRDGRHAARVLAGGLAASGITVVSGMARGVDTAAHMAAIELPGSTVAVLGTGVDVVYPSENTSLYQSIVEKGLVISEFAPGSAPEARHFPVRNRIISGLALGVLVVEAAQGSGSLITARMALEQNRAVYAVGGGVGEQRFRGCQELIRQGAMPVFSYEDILRDLQVLLASHCDTPVQMTFFPADKKSENLLSDFNIKHAGIDVESDISQSKIQAASPTDADASEDRCGLDTKSDFSENCFQPEKTSSSATKIHATSSSCDVKAKTSASFVTSRVTKKAPKTLSSQILVVLARLGALSCDDICEELAMPASQVSAELVLLEVDGRVLRGLDGKFSLV